MTSKVFYIMLDGWSDIMCELSDSWSHICFKWLENV